jgi:hypothetical protein
MPVETATACPNPEALAAFIDGRLAGAERRRLVEHLAACERCFETAVGVVEFLDEEGTEEGAREETEAEVMPFSARRAPLRPPASRPAGAAPERGGPLRPVWAAALAAAAVVAAVGGSIYLYRLWAEPPALAVAELVAPLAPGVRSAEGPLWRGPTRSGAGEAASPGLASIFRLGVLLVDLQASLARSDADESDFPLREIERLVGPDELLFAGEDVIERVRRAAEALRAAGSDEARRRAASEIERTLDAYFALDEAPELGLGKWVEAGRLSARLQDRSFFQAGSPGQRYLRWLRRHGEDFVPPEALAEVERVAGICRREELGPSDLRELEQAFQAIDGLYRE